MHHIILLETSLNDDLICIPSTEMQAYLGGFYMLMASVALFSVLVIVLLTVRYRGRRRYLRVRQDEEERLLSYSKSHEGPVYEGF